MSRRISLVSHFLEDITDSSIGSTLPRLVGFDELEGGDDFATKTLEIGMVHCGKFPAFFFSVPLKVDCVLTFSHILDHSGVLNKFPGSTNSQFPRLHLKQDEEGSSSSSSRTKLRSGTKNNDDGSDFDD